MPKILTVLCTVVTAVATSVSAYYGRIQAEMASLVGEPQLRAYVNAYVDEVPEGKNDQNDAYVDISFKNYGQTLARGIKSSFLVHPERLPPEEIVPQLVEHPGRYNLGNNQPFGYRIPLAMTGDEYHRLAQARGQRYVYVSAKYADIFSKKHYANFCFVLRPKLKSASLAPCGFFDDAD